MKLQVQGASTVVPQQQRRRRRSLLPAPLQQPLQSRLQQRQQRARRLLAPPPLLRRGRCAAVAPIRICGWLISSHFQRQLVQLVCRCVWHPARRGRQCSAGHWGGRLQRLAVGWLPHRCGLRAWLHRAARSRAPQAPGGGSKRSAAGQAGKAPHLAVPVTCAPSRVQLHLNSKLSSKPARFLPRTSHWCASPLRGGAGGCGRRRQVSDTQRGRGVGVSWRGCHGASMGPAATPRRAAGTGARSPRACRT